MCNHSYATRAHRHVVVVYNIGQIACCSVRAIRFCARAQTHRVDHFHECIIAARVHRFVFRSLARHINI